MNAITSVHENAGMASTQPELYPTVNNGTFIIRTSNAEYANEKFSLTVIDISGREVYSTLLSGQTEYRQTLSLPSGMYFARIAGDKIRGVKSFIVQ